MMCWSGSIIGKQCIGAGFRDGITLCLVAAGVQVGIAVVEGILLHNCWECKYGAWCGSVSRFGGTSMSCCVEHETTKQDLQWYSSWHGTSRRSSCSSRISGTAGKTCCSLWTGMVEWVSLGLMPNTPVILLRCWLELEPGGMCCFAFGAACDAWLKAENQAVWVIRRCSCCSELCWEGGLRWSDSSWCSGLGMTVRYAYASWRVDGFSCAGNAIAVTPRILYDQFGTAVLLAVAAVH
jgi:hypothetical protein